MATEHEIDRMVVRLVGNQEDYQKMLKDVEKQTANSAKYAEEQGSKISKAFNAAFKVATGMVVAGGAVSAPLGKGAADFSEYGKGIREIVRETEKASKQAAELQKQLLSNTEAYKDLGKAIKLTEEQASVFRLMSERSEVSLEDLIKTVKIGSAEYEIWRKQAEKFGLVLSKDQVKAANELGASWSRVKDSMKGLWTQIGVAVAGNFKELNDLIVGIVTWAIKWVKENKELIGTIAGVASKVAMVGTGLVAVLSAVSAIAPLVIPITAAIAAGALAWKNYGEGLKEAYNVVVAYGRQILDYTNKITTGIFDAIKAGNLALAVEVLWSGIKVAWIKSLSEVSKLTNERFAAIFDSLAAGNWKNIIEAMWLEIKATWLKGVDFLDDYWDKLSDGFDAACTVVMQTWNTTLRYIEDRLKGASAGISAFLNLINPALGSAVGSLGSMVPVTDAEGLNKGLDADLEKRRAERKSELLQREVLIKNEIAALDARRSELEAEGNKAAAEKLKKEEEILNAALARAEAERKVAEATAASGAATHDAVTEARRLAEIDLDRERQRQGYTSQYDPIEAYRESLKKLNYAFNESEKGGKVFQRAIMDIKEQMIQGQLKFNLEFGVTGLDVVRAGTREYRQLMEGAMENQMRREEEARAMREVAERDAADAAKKKKADEEAAAAGGPAPAGEGPPPEAVASAADATIKGLPILERIAISSEKLSDRPVVQLEPLGLA